MEMRSRMLPRRLVATTDVPAGAADPQVNPLGMNLQALLAAARTGSHLVDRGHMLTLALQRPSGSQVALAQEQIL